jgi:glycerophosphoryl diester phosphodiesterase
VSCRIIGHRGARNEAPENTIESFVHAQKHGCRAFELDVQLSADHELMVFHDTGLRRTTGHRGKLSDFNASILTTLDARFGGVYWHEACPIPTLQQVLDVCSHTEDWQLEVKPCNRLFSTIIAHKLIKMLTNKHAPQGRVTVTSSNIWFLQTIKHLNPRIRTGLVNEFRKESAIRKAKNLKCDLLALNQRLCSKNLVDAAHENNLEVSIWTVNDLKKKIELEKMGVDSVITDVPTKFIGASKYNA